MRQILGDGQWHPYSSLVQTIAEMVPPGEASRQAERLRRITSDAPIRVQQTGLGHEIWIGQKYVATSVLRGGVRRGTFELDRPMHPGVWSDPQLRIRWPDAGLVPFHRAMEWLGLSHTQSRQLAFRIRRGEWTAPEVLDRTRGPQIHRADLTAWATWLNCRDGKGSLDSGARWRPLSRDVDGLWDTVRKQWMLAVDGSIVSRKVVVPRGVPLDVEVGTGDDEGDD